MTNMEKNEFYLILIKFYEIKGLFPDSNELIVMNNLIFPFSAKKQNLIL